MTKKLSFSLIALATLLFTGCEKGALPVGDDLKAKLAGCWEMAKIDGTVCLTEERQVMNFKTDGSATVSLFLLPSDTTGTKMGKTKFTYNIYSSSIDAKMMTADSVNYEIYLKLKHFMSDNMTGALTYRRDGKDIFYAEEVYFVKNTEDISKNFHGMWEGVKMSPDSTYAANENRWRFYYDGTFIHYVLNDEKWQKSADEDCKFVQDGNWMNFSWTDAEGEHAECWDITSCDSKGMVWTGLRQKPDTTARFTETFELKKIEQK